MCHFRLNIFDSRGGGVFGGFGRGIVEIRGAIGLGKEYRILKPSLFIYFSFFFFIITNEMVERTGGLLGEALFCSHGACRG